MKSHFLGFIIDIQSQELKLSDFMDSLAKTLSHDIGPSDSIESRKLFINSNNPDFYIGMVITIKDQKKFCQGNITQNDFSFDIVDLKKDNKILEFNYFIINRKTGHGLYQYYHQSCSLSALAKQFRKLFSSYRQQKIKLEIQNAEILNPQLSNYARNKLSSKYQGKLELNIIIQQKKLENILKTYKKIKSFEYEYVTLTPQIIAATPLSGHVEKKREKLTFKAPTDIFGLATSISDFVQKGLLKLGNIKAEDQNDEEVSLRIFDMPDYFAIYEFDDLADKLANIKTSQFYLSDLVQLLIQCHNDPKHHHIF